MERLGHWAKNSAMPRHYDSEACATELQTRKTVADALRTGWRPATDGNLPAPCTPAAERIAPGTPAATSQTVQSRKTVQGGTAKSEEAVQNDEQAEAKSMSGPVVVFNTQRKKLHRAFSTKTVSICGWWTCGTSKNPSRNAHFGSSGTGTKCTQCFCR